jgi:hypothetical protein
VTDKPLDIFDRRRSGAGDNTPYVVRDTNGAGPNIFDLFNDRRYCSSSSGNGKGKTVSMGKGRRVV